VTQAPAYIAAETPRASPELDTATLQACRAGEPAALRAFVVRYERAVFAFISRALGSGPDVEDLAQEVFLRAFRALGRFDASSDTRPSTWLLTIASRLVVDVRRKRHVLVLPLHDDLVAPARGTPETESNRAELGRAIARAAAQLTDEQRDVFVLAEFHGLEMAEIAQVLSVAQGTVKTRLFRARERLRTLLEGVWEDP